MVHGKVYRGPWSFVSKRPAKVRHAPSDCLPPDAMECLLRHRGDDLRVVRALAGVDGEDAEESKLLLERRGGTGSGSLGGRGSLGGLFDSLIQEDRNGSHDVEDGKIPAIGGPEPADGGSTGPAIGGPEPADGGSTGPAIGGPAPAISGSTGPAIGFPCRWRLHGLCLGCGTRGCQGCIRGGVWRLLGMLG